MVINDFLLTRICILIHGAILFAIQVGHNTIRYDTMHYICVRPKADKASLIWRMEPNKNTNEEN